jgi:Ca-activated chloride channel family protein
MKKHRALNPANTCAGLVLLALAIAMVLATCGVLLFFNTVVPSTSQTSTAVLELAYSPEKEALIQDVVSRFNRAGFQTVSGKPMSIVATKMEPADMVDAVRAGRFTVVSPDSSLWLTQIDAGLDRPLVGESTRYAVTPIVVAMWADAAKSLGYPKPISWQDLLAKAQSDPNFRWSHPSTTNASGLLATLAEFYAGAKKTRALTEEDVKNRATLDYVAALEKTVRYYGEGEQATIDQVLAKGRNYLDAFVVSERMVIFFNSKSQAKLVAIYPAEGTLWQDHPLALIEQPGLTDDQRLTYRRLRDYVLSPEIQKIVLQYGYRPVDLNLRLDTPPSPILTQNGVDPAQPQTTLQMPNASVIQVVQSSWYLTKRPANIYLVVDTSGSMDDQSKLTQVQDALKSFLDQIQGDRDRVGMIPFSSRVYGTAPLGDIGTQRDALKRQVSGLSANGQTALLDAISFAYDDLQRLGQRDRINAIVVMTDGIENASSINLSQLIQRVKSRNQSGVPVLIFCIAYGSDADLGTLTSIAEATGGQARRADPDTIRRLYKILSTYF